MRAHYRIVQVLMLINLKMLATLALYEEYAEWLDTFTDGGWRRIYNSMVSQLS